MSPPARSRHFELAVELPEAGVEIGRERHPDHIGYETGGGVWIERPEQHNCRDDQGQHGQYRQQAQRRAMRAEKGE